MSSEEEQQRFLDEASNAVRQHAFYMKQSIDREEVRETLKHASEMLRELRTGLLTPRNYYSLYMTVQDEMRHLEMFFQDEHRRSRPMVELYEMVQSCGNVLPRMYLLITVGSVYIESREAPAKDILLDLVEMVKGVQHPTRGLFLRAYLMSCVKDKLPDVGSPYEGAGGRTKDSVDFILQNLAEATRLWTRLSQGRGNKKKKEQERKDLRMMVGVNLVRLSQLEGVDLETYRALVLPRILEQVQNSKDAMAQEYLFECTIQVFGDNFHVHTLETLLGVVTGLKSSVDVKAILIALMNRLANYAEDQNDAIPNEIPAFRLLNDCVARLIQEATTFDAEAMLSLQTALLQFASRCFPGRLDYVNHCLGFCATVLERVGASIGPTEERYVERLLSAPLESLALQVLDLPSFPALLGHLSHQSRKDVSLRLLKAVLDANQPLSDADTVMKVFEFSRTLIRDEEDAPAAPAGDDADDAAREFEEEQMLVARLVHLMRAEDTDTQFELYAVARRHFGQGGVQRIQYTLPPLVFCCLRLVQVVRQREVEGAELQQTSRRVLKFIHEIVTALGPSYPELAIKLFLQCAAGAGACAYEAIAYEFITQAFVLYEDELSSTRAQTETLRLIIGTLCGCRAFEEQNNAVLVTKTSQYAARLLRKAEQASALTAASHLFWVGTEGEPGFSHDANHVLQCLQRALKQADSCMGSSNTTVMLFVEILNHYLYYYQAGAESITVNYVNVLIDLIRGHLQQLEAADREQVQMFFNNTLSHIRRNAQAEGEHGERFRAIELGE